MRKNYVNMDTIKSKSGSKMDHLAVSTVEMPHGEKLRYVGCKVILMPDPISTI